MTSWIAYYLMTLAAVTTGAFMAGTARDALAALSLWIAAGLVYAGSVIAGSNHVGTVGAIWTVHAAMVLVLFSRPADTLLALFSAVIAILAALALFGILPSERGQGIAANFWHYSTMVNYGQLGVIAISIGRNWYVRVG